MEIEMETVSLEFNKRGGGEVQTSCKSCQLPEGGMWCLLLSTWQNQELPGRWAPGHICGGLSWWYRLGWETPTTMVAPFPREEILDCVREERVRWVQACMHSLLSASWLWLQHDQVCGAPVAVISLHWSVSSDKWFLPWIVPHQQERSKRTWWEGRRERILLLS